MKEERLGSAIVGRREFPRLIGLLRCAAASSRSEQANHDRVSEILNDIAYAHERIVLQRHGKDLVARICAQDLAHFQEFEDRAGLLLMASVLEDGETVIAGT
jgi:hypothetical protein